MFGSVGSKSGWPAKVGGYYAEVTKEAKGAETDVMIAAAAVFLLENDCITGQVINVDGGRAI